MRSLSLIRYFRSRLLEWEGEHFSCFPWRTTENMWHALVAEIMLQRTNAPQVSSVFVSFARKYRTPLDFVRANSPDVFSNLGLHWREKRFKELANSLSHSEIPEGKKELMRLPGIGDYISSSFRSLHLNLRDAIIDSNVVRLYGRFFGFETDGETRRKKWFIELAQKITPKKNFREFNYGVIDFTRQVCRPTPLCKSCIFKRRCKYY